MASSDPIAAEELLASPTQRWTLDGDDGVEARIAADQRLIADAVTDLVPAEQFVALVLMGGYGRGEGGYVRTADGPAPYNDYDYFVVVQGTDSGARAALAESLSKTAHALEARVGVEVDFALLRAERLRRAEFSLMNAEMRWGHRVVAGRDDVLLGMRAMPFHRLPPGEITRLMLNRGALLLMNQLRLAAGGGLDAGEREQHFKYLFKAVLACGDARLAALGRYHPSYPVKRLRLEAPAATDPSGPWPDGEKFFGLYQLAYEHKFHPDYAAFTDASPSDWQDRVVRTWLASLRGFETRRLGRPIPDWHAYCGARLGKGQSANTPRNLAVTLRDFGPLELLRRPRRAARYPRERLIAVLPLLLDESGSLLEPCVAGALALPRRSSWQQAAEAFLRRWTRYA